MVGVWAEYEQRGLWGLWSSLFSGSFELGLGLDNSSFVFSAAEGVRVVAALPPGSVFRWESRFGAVVQLYAEGAPPGVTAESWTLLLECESAKPDLAPTFLPFFPSVHGFAATINDLVLRPPTELVVNGQPGTGKESVLQSLALLYGGVRIDNRSEAMISMGGDRAPAILVPEVALLEPAEQQALQKHLKAGGRLWAASVYDLQALRARKILSPALADSLVSARILFPPVAKRSAEELRDVSAFWQAFYGVADAAAQANLDFQKSRVLGKNALSVESILEEGRGLRGVIAEFEKEAILKAQARVGRSQHKIANLLKVSRGSLQHKLRKYHLESYASADADTDNEG